MNHASHSFLSSLCAVPVCVIRRERAEAIATEKRKKGFPIKIPGIITLYSLPDGSYKLLDGQHRHATRPDHYYVSGKMYMMIYGSSTIYTYT